MRLPASAPNGPMATAVSVPMPQKTTVLRVQLRHSASTVSSSATQMPKVTPSPSTAPTSVPAIRWPRDTGGGASIGGGTLGTSAASSASSNGTNGGALGSAPSRAMISTAVMGLESTPRKSIQPSHASASST